jgi:acetate---CoA ligase (ADP-forming) subunit alpha
LAKQSSIRNLFEPQSIAIIGASRTPGKIGHEIVRNIRMGGYEGKVYPVNPKAKSILGFKAFGSVLGIPERVDLAVVVLAAEKCTNAIFECGTKGIGHVIVISSGFSEAGHPELEEALVSTARKSGIRIVGPNTFGIFFARSKMNATFGPNFVLPGKTAFISQSGALGLALMDWTTEEKYGISSIVSIGNKADVDDADLIEFFNQDPSTSSILIYMEGLKKGRKFYAAAKKISRKKPIVVIKAGSSKRGAQAASSHTGSIAGQDAVFTAAFEEAGVMRASTMTQAFDWIQAINENPLPKGEGIVIVTNGGGIGVLATDACENLGLNLLEVPQDVKDQIGSFAPNFGSLKNPIDLTANADDTTYGNVVSLLLKRKEVDAIIALFCQTANIDPILVAEALIRSKSSEKDQKPMTAALLGGHMSQLACSRMLEKRFAAYPTAERAVDSMYALIRRARQLSVKKD